MRFPPVENQMHPNHYKALSDYVRNKTRESKGVTPPETDISDEVLMGILEVLYSLRTALETDEGSVWLYRLTGVEERQPHVGFFYFLVTPQADGHNIRIPLNTKISSPYNGDHHRSLTIYALNTQDQKRDVTHELVEQCRRWLYGRRDTHPVKSASFIRYVLEYARDWFLGPDGMRWLQEQYAYPTKLKVYKALSMYGETAYKVTESDGKSFWVGGKIEGMTQKSWIEYEPKEFRMCDSCGQKYPCIQESEYSGTLCCSCLAQTGRDSLGVLDFCSHKECQSISCPNSLSLVQVRTRQARWQNIVDVGVGT